jgi:hypothetical protein
MKQNTKTVIITTGGIIGISLSVFFLTFVVLAWTGPQHTPPTCESGEVGCDEVLHTGSAAQSKAGGLLLNTGGATNGLIVQSGNVGIGTASPDATLHIEGTVKMFGSWETKNNNTVYQAETDGFVLASSPYVSGPQVIGYTDSSNPPTILRIQCGVDSSTTYHAITMPVRKDDYWKVTGAATIYWVPFGI